MYDDVVVLGTDGRFEAIIAIEFGANIIEVVTSIATDEQDSRVITVVYLP